MSSDPVNVEDVMCGEMYRLFSTLVAELTDVCVNSQKRLDEYKQQLPSLAIPNTVRELDSTDVCS